MSIYFRLRYFAIRFLLPISWKRFPFRRGQYFQEFAAAELDTCWQLLRAIPYCPGSMKGYFFLHAAEEMEHFRIFTTLKETYSEKHLKLPMLKRHQLFDTSIAHSPRALSKFLAEVYVGELGINSDFRAHADALKNFHDVREALDCIQAQEVGHEQGAQFMAQNRMHYSKISLNIFLFRHIVGRIHASLKKASEAFSLLPMTFLLFLAYVLLAPFAIIQVKHRFRLSREEELNIFKAQALKMEREFC